KNLGIKQDIPQQTVWDSLLPGLIAGRWDLVAAAMALTKERQEVAAGTDPVYYYAEVPFVKAGNPKGIHSIKYLISKDVKIGLHTGTADPVKLPQLGVPKEKFVLIDDYTALWIALEQGRVDMLFTNTVGGLRYIKTKGTKGIEMADPWDSPP